MFTAYLDVEFDNALAAIDGLITFGDDFGAVQNPMDGDIANISSEADNDFGASGDMRPSQTDEQLLFTIPMVASAVGTLELASNGPDNLPLREFLIYPNEGDDDLFNVTNDRVVFGDTTLTIVSEVAAAPFTNPRNRYDVDDNGVVAPRDALILISNMNDFGARRLSTDAVPVSSVYLDVNSDGFISPSDLLNVIRKINERAGSGEPEGAALAAIDAAFDVDNDEDDLLSVV